MLVILSFFVRLSLSGALIFSERFNYSDEGRLCACENRALDIS